MEAYKRRMVIEYQELKERAEKLAAMLDKWDKGTLDFTPTCPKYLLEKQLDVMKDYVGLLQTRAKIEDVDLTANVNKSGWIPVTERLPGNFETVLVWIGGSKIYDVAFYDMEHGFRPWYAGYYEDCPEEWECPVSAWMPLSEPYEEEKRNA